MKLEKMVSLVVRDISPKIREDVALNPITAFQEHFGLSVRSVDHLGDSRGDGGACDGMSYLDQGVILYSPSHFSNRQNFTLAHEFAHWLIEKNDFVFGWLADQDHPQRVLESLCDAVGQALLLPEDLIDEAVSYPVRASQVLELQAQSAASLPVSAIAAATRLRTVGAIVLIKRQTMEVTSSSVHPDPDEGWPAVVPWPGETVPDGHFLVDMAPNSHQTRRSFWRNRWGRREDYFIDAVAGERQICAVFSGTDIWSTTTLPYLVEREYVARPIGAFQCCGEWREVKGFPCSRCGQGYCPVCGNCKCTKVTATEGVCQGCFTITPAHLLKSGLCEDCA